MNQERNLNRTSLAKGKKREKEKKKSTNKQQTATAAATTSKNRKKRTTHHHWQQYVSDFQLENVKQGHKRRANIFIALLDHAYEVLLANIKMECQRWPEKL